MRQLRWLWVGLLLMGLNGCRAGAVTFAPAAPPPDTSPVRYEHPSGAFSLLVPRQWAVGAQHLDALATASFAPPNDPTPRLRVSAIRLEAPPTDSVAFGALLDTYQTQVRPDARRYSEQDRRAMGDGSWRLVGVRTAAGGTAEQVNTFVDLRDGLWLMAEVVLTDDPAANADLERVVNTLAVGNAPTLAATPLTTLAYARPEALNVLNVGTWTTAGGVFFVTGEVSNDGDVPLWGVPVRAVLYDAEGRALAEAVDVAMGHAVQPGAFAPFSLRFGQGQPPGTTAFRVFVGGGDADAAPDGDATVLGADTLSWTEDATLDDSGRLVVRGELTNTGDAPVYLPRVTVTVFDGSQRVVAAAFTDLEAVELAAGATTPYQVVVPEMGAAPARYIVNWQARP